MGVTRTAGRLADREEVDRAGQASVVGVALGLDDVAVDDDRAVPVTGGARQLGERWPEAGA